MLLGDRYSLRSLLGHGGQSEVWEAEDKVGGGAVAVKLLYGLDAAALPRLRGEISILRLHQLPGVVRLLDEGASERLPFLVMELVRGRPFPGAGRLRSWPALSDTTVALVETLARIHAEGVIHQDLKPANVLVSDDGKPTILDFGIASDRRLEEPTDDDDIMGTVAYMAPERLRGEAVTPRSDLYSLGVLLFEALTGTLPHHAPHTRALIRACAQQDAPSIRSLAPKLPADVAGLVDLLLSKSPHERPGSAMEVLGILRGHPAARRETQLAIDLGGAAQVSAILARGRAGESVDLIGPRGTGRSRVLGQVKDALEREGIHAVMLRPASQPFASVAPIVGALEDQWSASLVEVAAVVDARLGAALAAGRWILADDVDRADVHSAAALERCRGAGRIVRVFEEGRGGAAPLVRTAPLDQAALAGLFAGPERLFHLRSAPAALLAARTGGVQARVAEELSEWARGGVVSMNGARLTVARDMLDRLKARPPAPWFGRGCEAELPRGLEDLLVQLWLTWPDGRPDLLSASMKQPVWQIEAQLEELVRRGLARPAGEGAFEPPAPLPAGRAWSVEQRRAGHRTIAAAMRPGAPRRFLHLALGLAPRPAPQEVVELAEESITHARLLAGEGDLKQAMAALKEALLWTRRADTPASIEERLLATLLDVALAEGVSLVVGEVQYEIGRARKRSEVTAQLDHLVQAALAYAAGGDRALRLLAAIPPFVDLDLERRRQGLRALAARRCTKDVEDATIEDVSRWAAGAPDPVTQARLASWLGWWCYRRDRFAEAASWHARAAEGDPWPRGRASARIAAASALMETFDLEAASRWAAEALREARGCGSPYVEARAEWVCRAIHYRQGGAGEPDLELVAAVEQVRVRDIEAAVCLTEAAFAYRGGLCDQAYELAQRAASIWRFVHDPWPEMLARCVALATGGEPASRDEIADLGRRACDCRPPGLGIQALGLLARTHGAALPAWRHAVPGLVAGVPRAAWGLRMDVLSVEESLAALGVELSPRLAPDTAP